MHIESVALTNFRCFGQAPTLISLSSGLTTFIGANGAGKTAMMQALQRMFGVTNDQRRIKRQDFHVPANETLPATQRTFVLEAMIAFPELDNDGDTGSAIPEFFHHMAADYEGKLKCRLRLEATWSEDGSVDGSIEQKYWAIRTFGPFTETDCVEIKAADRTRIQMVYVPASRDGSSQVSAFLRGRLWRAISWSEQVRSTFSTTGQTLNSAFSGEAAVGVVAASVTRRWQEVHSAGTDTTPMFRPIDLRFQEFIRKVEVVFRPDEAGRERALEDLSDGQKSLFHLAMTAATLDVEGGIAANPASAGFQPGGVALPSLTLIAVEEPENNLSPFYLSQIVRQIEDLTRGLRAQAIVSSHSPSILSRVDPTQVRHFRLEAHDRTARINSITLPPSDEAASKFIREAVRAYPELYFARFVVLGEGASEEVVLPRLADALKLNIDRSFVAVVPLGGRHVNHLWKLLTGLKIPYATLLDLDWGRDGGGWGRIKTACTQLLANGTPAEAIFRQHLNPAGPHINLAAFDSYAKDNLNGLIEWVRWLRQFNVFFCAPLDLDYSMLKAMPTAYRALEPGRLGPSDAGNVREAVFGEGDPKLYPADHDDDLKWYRYLFLGRGKPSTHVRVLGGEALETIAASVPEELSALLTSISARLSQKAS